MKKILLSAILCCSFTVCTTAQEQTNAKNTAKPAKDSLLPYQKNPKLPAFNILSMDSVTIFNTYNIPEGDDTIAILFFSPDCGHCRRTTRRIIDSIDLFKNFRFYLVTPVHSMPEIRDFYDEFHLADYKNIMLVGRDYEFFFGSFYGVRVVPDIVLYDGHKKLIKLVQGETYVSRILDLPATE